MAVSARLAIAKAGAGYWRPALSNELGKVQSHVKARIQAVSSTPGLVCQNQLLGKVGHTAVVGADDGLKLVHAHALRHCLGDAGSNI